MGERKEELDKAQKEMERWQQQEEGEDVTKARTEGKMEKQVCAKC